MNELTDKAVLKMYLNQYYRAKRKKNILEKRLETFRYEMYGPRRGKTDGMPKIKGKHNPVILNEIVRTEEIEDRIESQREEMREAMLNVMSIMELLPIDSTERNIIEERHIDCMQWDEICQVECLTRSPANEHYNRGIERLLANAEVEHIVETYRKKLQDSTQKDIVV